jgi:CRP-like cAMP-binding protein
MDKSIDSVYNSALTAQSKKQIYSVHGERALIIRRRRAALTLQEFVRLIVLAHSRARAGKWGARTTDNRMLTWLNEAASSLERKETIYEKSLRHLPFFKQYSKAVAMRLIDASSFRCYDDSDVVFWQGDPGDCAYVVVSGEINIYVGQNMQQINAEQKGSALPQNLCSVPENQRKIPSTSDDSDHIQPPKLGTSSKLTSALKPKSASAAPSMSLAAATSKASRTHSLWSQVNDSNKTDLAAFRLSLRKTGVCMNVIKRGQIFGEYAALSGLLMSAGRTATAMSAVDETALLVIPSVAYNEIVGTQEKEVKKEKIKAIQVSRLLIEVVLGIQGEWAVNRGSTGDPR